MSTDDRTEPFSEMGRRLDQLDRIRALVDGLDLGGGDTDDKVEALIAQSTARKALVSRYEAALAASNGRFAIIRGMCVGAGFSLGPSSRVEDMVQGLIASDLARGSELAGIRATVTEAGFGGPAPWHLGASVKRLVASNAAGCRDLAGIASQLEAMGAYQSPVRIASRVAALVSRCTRAEVGLEQMTKACTQARLDLSNLIETRGRHDASTLGRIDAVLERDAARGELADIRATVEGAGIEGPVDGDTSETRTCALVSRLADRLAAVTGSPCALTHAHTGAVACLLATIGDTHAIGLSALAQAVESASGTRLDTSSGVMDQVLRTMAAELLEAAPS